eukprot:g19023.t1
MEMGGLPTEVPSECKSNIWGVADYVFGVYYAQHGGKSPLEHCYFNGRGSSGNTRRKAPKTRAPTRFIRTAALQIEQPLFWSGSSSDAIRPPPGLAPTVGAKAQSPMPAEPEPESRSDAENAPHSSAASTADTENIAGVHVASTVPSAEVPTRGSAGHGLGACKPCAFFYKASRLPCQLEDGCQSGFECAFCHLCPPGEKIRRKKELKQRRKLNKKQ